MSQENLAKLQCSKCGNTNYWTSKNKKKVERNLEFKKFCRKCVAHTLHTEGKKKKKK
ncbi:MAG: 50S ribosomal protein L33 [Candidatus Spechtbacteria bacterium RIFCSPLOWO2_02_FULL_38_8]|uniref:Large ribosomal subunit protein bL33 n=1 Tax=Candidatus Spechtbacteria bacterium RIFCSPLOWO2_02_FULL_38_8 TaxID=1802164 RepID=A0A1G2HIA2_9BACT|nr:MAG: 50S ribosomal protein L33 [Candidatus Spechtbacteria bacterium RIFCSPLOWO2_02_FULL_38_8]